jgi:hypothetical protein
MKSPWKTLFEDSVADRYLTVPVSDLLLVTGLTPYF